MSSIPTTINPQPYLKILKSGDVFRFSDPKDETHNDVFIVLEIIVGEFKDVSVRVRNLTTGEVTGYHTFTVRTVELLDLTSITAVTKP